jgi:hypothetical protein
MKVAIQQPGMRKPIASTTFLAGLVLSLCLLLPVCSSAFGPGVFHYSIRHEGKPVGYCELEISRDTGSDGQRLYRLQGKSGFYLSHGLESTQRRYRTIQTLEADTLIPIYTRRRVTQAGLIEQYETRISGDTALSKASLAAVPLDIFEFTWSDKDVILDDLSLPDWLQLAKRFGQLEEAIQLRAFVPRQRVRTPLRLSPAGLHEIVWDGVKIKCQKIVAEIQEQTAEIWLDEKTAELFYLDVPAQGFTLVRSGPEVKQDIENFAVMESLVEKSDFKVEEAEKFKSMKFRLHAQTFGERLTSADLNTSIQQFNGKVSPTEVNGLFTVTTTQYDSSPSPGIREIEITEEFRPYVKAEIGIESNDPRIIEKAKEITEGSGDAWEAAVRCGIWVNENIRSDLLVQGSALTGLVTGFGASGTKAKLVAALCRSLGIPARQAGGLVLAGAEDQSAFIPHYWCEIAIDGSNWRPIDPVFERYTRLPAFYVKFVHLGGIRKIENLQIIETQNREKEPMPLKPFDITLLESFEPKRFQYFIGDVNIGQHEIRPLGQVDLNNQETWGFSESTFLDSTPAGHAFKVESSARYYVSASGRPAYYRYEEEVNGQVCQATCEFTPNEGMCRWESGRQSLQIQLPNTAETFLLNRNMIGEWLFLTGRLPWTVGEKLSLQSLIPAQPVTVEITLLATGTDTFIKDDIAIDCILYEAEPHGDTLWINKEGHLVRIVNDRQNLEIRLADFDSAPGAGR